MPVARIKLPDGRIGRLQVPDGASQEEVLQMASTMFAQESQAVQPSASGEPGMPSISATTSVPTLVNPQQPTLTPEIESRSMYSRARPYIAPIVEGVPSIAGAVLGTPLGGVGGVAGAGLGYALGKELMETLDTQIGDKRPRQGLEHVIDPVMNTMEGATWQVVGGKAGELLGKGLGKVADVRNLPYNKAAKIARNALGADADEVLNALKAAKGQNVSAGQATADINSPTWQALVDRAVKRDPRFLAALEKSQGEVSINALARLAGGSNAAGVRSAQEAAKSAVRDTTTPMREAALNRANLGKEVARLEGLSAELGEQAATKVQEVRRLMELGDIATANARLGLIKRDLPVGLTKYTYSGELAEKAFKEWSDKAAQASLDLGQGSRFAQEAARVLRVAGVKPLQGDPLVRSLKAMGNNPEFAGNDILQGAMNNVTDDISKWVSTGGIIDARALDAIRKNSVNAAIAKLRPGMDASSQKNLASSVLSRVKPVIDDAIEAAGGVGYRKYLETHSKEMAKVAEKRLTGEALRLWKTNKNAFIDLVQNESPDVVEKILGPGRYDIAKELSDDALQVLRTEASKAIRDASVKTQVEGGQQALKELMVQHMKKIRIPAFFNPVITSANSSLSVLEERIGRKTLETLTNSLKTPNGAANLIESLPAAEKARVLQILSNPETWVKPGGVAAINTARSSANSLMDEDVKNALIGE